MLTELTIKEFINKVLSNDPVPGGGSVSALNGALATSLAAMVANLTIGRKKYVEVNEIMEDLSVRFEELTRQLITDVDRDSEAYDRVSLHSNFRKKRMKKRLSAVKPYRRKPNMPPKCLWRWHVPSIPFCP